MLHGIDDTRRSTIASLANSQSIASTLSTSSGTGDSNQYAAGYVMFRYMAAQCGFTAEHSLSNFMQSLAGGKGL